MKKLFGTSFAILTIVALFMFLPATSGTGSEAFIGVQDACAQTGTCKVSPGDICFVNGNGYSNRAWESAPPV